MAQPMGSPDKMREEEDKARLDSDELNIVDLLEPKIVEAAARLGIRLALFKISMISDSAKFAEQLGLEPGDEVIIAFPQHEYSVFRALAETLKMKGVTVHSFISLKIPPDSFALGVRKRSL